jgi:short-subunit dehydrogenase
MVAIAYVILCPMGQSQYSEKQEHIAHVAVTQKEHWFLVFGQRHTHKPYTVTFDLADPKAITAAATQILQCFGYVDILVNNAGISYRGTILDTTVDVDKRVMEINYFGPIALTKGNILS